MPVVLDRQAHLRSDPAALAGLRARPDARYAPVWRGKTFVCEDDPPRGQWIPSGLVPFREPLVFLGVDPSGVPYFAVDVSDLETPLETIGPGRFIDLLRGGWQMAGADFEVLAYARGMMHWHSVAAACENCGCASMTVSDGGFKRVCSGCGRAVFPRSDPAVMILVTREDEVLLARQPRFPRGMYSALAGFVEPGESLEQCVHRETLEEVGLAVQDPVYMGSQPWPFPQSLMIGFRAEALSSRFSIDTRELEDARWFSRSELRAPDGFFYPPALSLAHHLIRRFIGSQTDDLLHRPVQE